LPLVSLRQNSQPVLVVRVRRFYGWSMAVQLSLKLLPDSQVRWEYQ
jgi:hypothetical protein